MLEDMAKQTTTEDPGKDPAPEPRRDEGGRRVYSDEEKRAIVQQVKDAGWSFMEAERQTGIPDDTIRYWMVGKKGGSKKPEAKQVSLPIDVGPEPQKYERGPSGKTRLTEAYKSWAIAQVGPDGKGNSAVAKRLGIHFSDLSRWRRERLQPVKARSVEATARRGGGFRNFSRADKLAYLEAAKAYSSTIEAAAALNISRTSLQKWRIEQANGTLTGSLDGPRGGAVTKLKREGAMQKTPSKVIVSTKTPRAVSAKAAKALAPVPPATGDLLPPVAGLSRREIEEKLIDLQEEVLILRMVVQRAERKGLWSTQDLVAGLFDKGRG